MRAGGSALGGSSMPSSERRSRWSLAAAAVSSVVVFVVVLGVVAWATNDAAASVVAARALDPTTADELVVGTAAAEATADEVLAHATSVLERCFQSTLAFDPSLGGSMLVRVTATGDGNGKIEVVQRGASPMFTACVGRQGAKVPLPSMSPTAYAEGRFALDAAKGSAVLDPATAALFP